MNVSNKVLKAPLNRRVKWLKDAKARKSGAHQPLPPPFSLVRPSPSKLMAASKGRGQPSMQCHERETSGGEQDEGRSGQMWPAEPTGGPMETDASPGLRSHSPQPGTNPERRKLEQSRRHLELPGLNGERRGRADQMPDG